MRFAAAKAMHAHHVVEEFLEHLAESFVPKVIGLAHQIRRSKNDSEKTQTADHLMGARLSNLADIGAGVISQFRGRRRG